MNYSAVIESAYKYFSFKKDILFLVLFWIAFPLIAVVPWALEKNLFAGVATPLVMIAYDAIYLVVIFAFVLLTTVLLSQKRITAPKITVKKFFAVFPLVFVELWYIFVWSLRDKFTRLTQLLLLLGIPLFFVYYQTVPSRFIYYSLVLFLLLYILIVLYNFVRLMFTVPLFYSRNIALLDAPKESWYLTHNKFKEVLVALVLALGTIVIIFFCISIVLAVIADIALRQFFIEKIAMDLALRGSYLFALAPALLCYYAAITEIFTQLLREQSSSSRIRTILAARVFGKKSAKHKTVVKKKKRK